MQIDEKDIEILMEDHCTRSEAVKHLRNGTTVYEVDELLSWFDEYADGLEDESKAKLKAFLEAGKPGFMWDNPLVIYEGVKYYISYCL